MSVFTYNQIIKGVYFNQNTSTWTIEKPGQYNCTSAATGPFFVSPSFCSQCNMLDRTPFNCMKCTKTFCSQHIYFWNREKCTDKLYCFKCMNYRLGNRRDQPP